MDTTDTAFYIFISLVSMQLIFFFFFNTSLLHDKEHKIKEPKQYFASSWVKPNKNFSLSF